MKSIIVALLTLSSTLGTAFAGPINLVANGDFESPALSGNGDIYSNNPSFSLPGWTVPTGANQFYLEYGQPFGGPRYNTGRQAVSLNCDGSPCSMSQTLNLIAGDTYTLTFALAEEQTNKPFSPTTISVDIGSSSKNFSLGNTNGYKIFSFDFIADSASTLLKFTDTTSSLFAGDSPLIDSVSVASPAEGGGTPPPAPTPAPEPATISLFATGLVLTRMFSRKSAEG